MKFLRFFLFVFILCVCSCVHADDALSSIEQRVQKFQDRYSIPLIYKDMSFIKGRVTFAPVPAEEYNVLNDYLNLFEEEINKYPPSFFKGRQVRAIALATHLFSGDKPAQGLYSSDARVMFFDIHRAASNKALQRHSIHHELFHMMAMQTPGYQTGEAAWSNLNSGGFAYGEQKKLLTDVNPVNRGAPNQLGFVTDYAMASAEEDKAEVFACLMQDAHKTLVTRWAEKDEVLRKKIRAIKDFVAIYCPEMNEKYWER